MRATDEKGFTLIELVLAITIMGIIAGTTVTLLSANLKAHNIASDRSGLHQEGLLTMERMTNGLRKTTVVAVPNGHSYTRDILAFSRLVNSDNDFYFGDPLFPRIDEDLSDDYSWCGNGILGVDEDDDGQIDEGDWRDEDEDGLYNEDPLDGLDNDGDGSIDEGTMPDSNNDGKNGIIMIDDDGDGTVDEQQGDNVNDDDEDGATNEEDILFVVYVYNSATNTLTEIHSDPDSGINSPAPQIVLSTQVTNFQAIYKSPGLIEIILQLTGEDGKVIDFDEHVYVRNVLQKNGKRVR
ncbi:hypothetical protein SCALIN_C01_0155 [Candidatus Scalindua japonica]|uniref:Prepilin-type N-terminal cleavage/methylation domain-containing protein n=1 Tax=Candidatus Scalindua japonica TaxID=1284222 RepID=A0A286TTN6_9BACT|nr:prepilin-type N-terminal cleavage/methylation domain-containing protein [Candidatus Scalindua japonica]GAX59224.1 hypothetical protein SCALIN_C01_0155 [Candidatus Scalindua japonica]